MDDMITLRVLDIVEGTSVDGPGLRTSIYFAGCRHHCPGCHNPQSWDESAGNDMPVDQLVEIVERNGFNVTFSGGDPMLQIPALTNLAQRLKNLGYGIWCYTGYRWEELPRLAGVGNLLPLLDVIVDGRFESVLRDTGLHFSGSSNQRLIDVAKSLAAGKPVLWPVGL